MKRRNRLVTAGAVLTSAVAAMSVVNTGQAAAEATSSPLSAIFRSCNHGVVRYAGASGTGGGTAVIGMAGSNVTAQVRIVTAEPDTRYTVRLIQVPRAVDRTCFEFDPGVAVGELFTDGIGTATTTVQGPLMPGATGAWVEVDGPPPPGQLIGDFLSTDLVAPLK